MRFHLEKREIVSNQAGPNEISALQNESQGQNNVSPSCDDIITWVDASFQAIYSTYHYQMDIYLTFKMKRSDINLPKPKDWVYLTVVGQCLPF